MINNYELLFIVDENNKPVRPQTRLIAHNKKLWHRIVHVWIINSDRVLCQKRSMLKDRKPSYWEPFF